MKIYIYQIYFPISDKSYIGQTKDLGQRMNEHLRSGSVVCHALWKYDDWIPSVLHTCQSRDVANTLEIEEIRNFNSIAPNGYNLTSGGEVRKVYCQETRDKISKARTGIKASEETKAKMSESMLGQNNPFYGKHHTEETKEKARRRLTGKTMPADFKEKMSKVTSGEKNGMYGKKHSEESKEKNRQSNLGKKISKLSILKSAYNNRKRHILKLEAELQDAGINSDE